RRGEARFNESQIANPKSQNKHGFSTADATNELALAANRAERLVAQRRAEAKLTQAEGDLALVQAEQSLAAARRGGEMSATKEDKDKAEAALRKAQELITTEKKNLEAAQAALSTNSNTYTPLTPIYPAQSTGRRRALATWIASRDNPLTARVAVN